MYCVALWTFHIFHHEQRWSFRPSAFHMGKKYNCSYFVIDFTLFITRFYSKPRQVLHKTCWSWWIFFFISAEHKFFLDKDSSGERTGLLKSTNKRAKIHLCLHILAHIKAAILALSYVIAYISVHKSANISASISYYRC